jgi:hypothetical protein
MNPVSMNKVASATPPPAGGVLALGAASQSVLPQLPFGRFMAVAKADGRPLAPTSRLQVPGLPCAPSLPRLAGGSRGEEPGEGAVFTAGLTARRSGPSSGAFDHGPRHYLGPSIDLAAWLSAQTFQQSSGSAADEGAVRSTASLEHLLPTMVRRVSWSSDGKRGTARLEIGSGDLTGATLIVHADAGRVRVLLELPPGPDARSWRERIVQRLASRDIPVDEVEVS